jgi:hypothetical protein
MTITQTVTWDDLEASYDQEFDDLREAYDELVEEARDEYGERWQSQPATDETLQVYQEQAEQYDEAAKSIQKRQHLLDQLKDRYGDGEFEIKMLTGEETMQVETELRMLAKQEDVGVDVIQVRRNALTVDAATIDAPDAVPRDEDGSPVPSESPNALTLALWDQVESLNNAGETGFRPEGFGDKMGYTPDDTSDPSTPSPESSTHSVPEDKN